MNIKDFNLEIFNIEGNFLEYERMCKFKIFMYFLCLFIGFSGLPLGVFVSSNIQNISFNISLTIIMIIFSIFILISIIIMEMYCEKTRQKNPVISLKNSSLSNAALIYIGNNYDVLDENLNEDILKIKMKE